MGPERIVAQHVLADAGGYRWVVQRADGKVAVGDVLYADATRAAKAAAAAVRGYAVRAATVAAYGGDAAVLDAA